MPPCSACANQLVMTVTLSCAAAAPAARAQARKTRARASARREGRCMAMAPRGHACRAAGIVVRACRAPQPGEPARHVRKRAIRVERSALARAMPTPIHDLRSFLEALSAAGAIHDFTAPVDRVHELGALLRACEQDGRAAWFHAVKGSELPVVGGLLGSHERIALALGCTRERLGAVL